jgi:hypothetical protein
MAARILTTMRLSDEVVWITGTCDPASQSRLLTPTGRRGADELIACSPAWLSVAGADANGEVVLTSRLGSTYGNSITYEAVAGAGLAVEVTGKAIRVTLGGSTTATEVVNALAASSDAAELVVGAAGGDGSGAAGAITSSPLAGGQNDGDQVDLGLGRDCPFAWVVHIQEVTP